jgi:hypothetical protein
MQQVGKYRIVERIGHGAMGKASARTTPSSTAMWR